MNKNQMSVDYVGEMVHNKKNRETGQFSAEKTEMAIPHQAFKCVTHKHKTRNTNTETFARVSISLSDVSEMTQVKVKVK